MAKPPAASSADPSTSADVSTESIAAPKTAKTAKTATIPAAATAPATAKVPTAKLTAAKAPTTAKLTAAKAPATAKVPAAEAPATAKLPAAEVPAVEEPVTSVPAVLVPVVKAPLRPRVTPAALRFAAVAYVATALTPLFLYLFIAFPGSSFAITASAYAYYIPFAIVLIALVVASVASDRPLPTKMVAILLAVIGASLIVMTLVVPVPWLPLLAPIPFFLSWALTAGFRGWGYLGLVLVLVTIGIQWLSGSLISWGGLFAIPAIVLAVIIGAAIAGTAALERVFARGQESAA